MSDLVTHAVVADATDEEVLRSLGIRNFDCGIVAIGDDIQTSILTAILLKELGCQNGCCQSHLCSSRTST